MLNVNIEKIERGKFKLTWKDFPELDLELNFNPFLKLNNLNKGIIVHWQSKPRSDKKRQGRTWGIYSLALDEYFSQTSENIPFFKAGRCQFLEISEGRHSSVPTAVVYFPDLLVEKSENLILIR